MLAKFDIGLSFRNEAAMQDALRRLEALVDDGVNLSTKTLAVHRAYLAAVQGDLPTAQSKAAEVAKHFTDEARARLLQKLTAFATGAPARTGNGPHASL